MAVDETDNKTLFPVQIIFIILYKTILPIKLIPHKQMNS